MKGRLNDFMGIAEGLAEGLAKERTSSRFKQRCTFPRDALVALSVARVVLQKNSTAGSQGLSTFPELTAQR